MRSTSQLRALTNPRKRIRARNPERAAAESLRANGDEVYRSWAHDQPCAICGYAGREIELMHVRGGGVGRKADRAFSIPACGPHWVRVGVYERTGLDRFDVVRGCHRVSHRGQKTFADERGIDLLELAAKTQRRFADYCRCAGIEEGAA